MMKYVIEVSKFTVHLLDVLHSISNDLPIEKRLKISMFLEKDEEAKELCRSKG